MAMQAPLSNGPFRCQIALQGGGAKIIALMAAMESVQVLQAQGRLKVTRIAGTSAGAVVAAMFAAGIDLKSARRELMRTLGPAVATQLTLPGKTGVFWRLGVRGRPLWDERVLASVLGPFFEEAGVATLGDILAKTRTHVHIVASVLSDSRKVVHSSAQPGTPIIAALLDSCAIPFCFRVWQHAGPVVVDGGLCENLPSDELLEHEKDDGPALAISFKSAWPGTQRNLKEFSLALLDTAISNSVSRAKIRLGLNRVCEIKTTLSTFDFDKATSLADTEVLSIQNQAASFVGEFVKQQRQMIQGDPWVDLNAGIMEGWWQIYTRQHANRLAGHNEHGSLVVQANCLAVEGESGYGEPDFVYYTLRFNAIEEMFCSQLALVPTVGEVSLNSSEIELTDKDGRAVDFVVVPARDPQHITKRPALIFYTPTLAPGSGPYTLRLRQAVRDFMAPLRDIGRDDLFMQTKAAKKPAGRVDLVLHVPGRLKHARVLPPSDVSGHEMTYGELLPYTAQPGFHTIGWAQENVPPGQRVRCEVVV